MASSSDKPRRREEEMFHDIVRTCESSAPVTIKTERLRVVLKEAFTLDGPMREMLGPNGAAMADTLVQCMDEMGTTSAPLDANFFKTVSSVVKMRPKQWKQVAKAMKKKRAGDWTTREAKSSGVLFRRGVTMGVPRGSLMRNTSNCAAKGPMSAGTAFLVVRLRFTLFLSCFFLCERVMSKDLFLVESTGDTVGDRLREERGILFTLIQ